MIAANAPRSPRCAASINRLSGSPSDGAGPGFSVPSHGDCNESAALGAEARNCIAMTLHIKARPQGVAATRSGAVETKLLPTNTAPKRRLFTRWIAVLFA